MTEHPSLIIQKEDFTNTKNTSHPILVGSNLIRPSLLRSKNKKNNNKDNSITSSSSSSTSSLSLPCPNLETDTLDQELCMGVYNNNNNNNILNRQSSSSSSSRTGTSTTYSCAAVRDLVIERNVPTSSLLSSTLSTLSSNVETYLEFSCMSKQEYDDDNDNKQQQQQEEEKDYDTKVDEKRREEDDPAIYISMEEEEEEAPFDCPIHSKEAKDFLENDVYEYDEYDEYEDETQMDYEYETTTLTLTPFMKLWKILSQWFTHDTLILVNTCYSWGPKDIVLDTCMNTDSFLYPTRNSMVNKNGDGHTINTINSMTDDGDDNVHPLIVKTQSLSLSSSPSIIITTIPTQQEQQENHTNTVTVSSSSSSPRYQGLMAMLKIYLPLCIEKLKVLQLVYNQSSMTYKMIEDRVGALVSSFDLYSVDMTVTSLYLNTSILWQACTMILVDIACLYHHDYTTTTTTTTTSTTSTLNPILLLQTTIQDFGLTMEEYIYLTKQTIQSLCTQYTTI